MFLSLVSTSSFKTIEASDSTLNKFAMIGNPISNPNNVELSSDKELTQEFTAVEPNISKPQRSTKSRKKKRKDDSEGTIELSEVDNDLSIRLWVNDHRFAHKLVNPNFDKHKANLQKFIDEGKLSDAISLLQLM